MKMAKATEADIEMAMELCRALEGLNNWYATIPEAIEIVEHEDDSERFNSDDAEQCQRVMKHLLNVMDKGSLGRVVWGAAVLLDPKNELVDPDASTLERHPDDVKAREARDPLPIEDWHEDKGNVLWWKFPIQEPPWCGQPDDSDWPGYHTHWTPLLVPNQPTEAGHEND